jgi:hypothetical protein
VDLSFGVGVATPERRVAGGRNSLDRLERRYSLPRLWWCLQAVCPAFGGKVIGPAEQRTGCSVMQSRYSVSRERGQMTDGGLSNPVRNVSTFENAHDATGAPRLRPRDNGMREQLEVVEL